MKLLLLTLGLLTFVPAVYQGNSRNPLASIAEFKSWTRLTSKPAYMPDYVASYCAPSREMRADPHRGHLIHVYVNSIGAREARKALKTSKPSQIKFPEGTILVKTKFGASRELTSSEPAPSVNGGYKIELMTVMIKQAKGASPKTGDWKFLIMDGAGKRVLEDDRMFPARNRPGSKRVPQCYSCHTDAKFDHAYLRYDEKSN